MKNPSGVISLVIRVIYAIFYTVRCGLAKRSFIVENPYFENGKWYRAGLPLILGT